MATRDTTPEGIARAIVQRNVREGYREAIAVLIAGAIRRERAALVRALRAEVVRGPTNVFDTGWNTALRKARLVVTRRNSPPRRATPDR